jgi:hypothetical protein
MSASLATFSSTMAQSISQVKSVAPPEPPHLPSNDPEDYILGLYHIFFTGDFSLLEKMTGPLGTQYHLPYAVGFNPPGKDNHKELIKEFGKASNLYKAQCVAVDPAKHSKFTVFFDGINFDGVEKDIGTYFLFMANDAGNWELLVIGTIKKELMEEMTPTLDACPINELEFPDERGAPEWFLNTTPAFTESPKNESVETKPDKPVSLFRRLFPQAFAGEICTPIRKPFNDGKPNNMECTEFVQKVRPDALCWLRKEFAHAKFWDDDAETLGKGIVDVDTIPRAGDIVVWNETCGGAYKTFGHVAIVTKVTTGTNGQTKIDVDQANRDGDGKFSSDAGLLVNINCMKFIHEPIVGVEPTPANENTASAPPEREQSSWWSRFWCFINPWCP